MDNTDFNLEVYVDGDYLVALWSRHPLATHTDKGAQFSRYPEVQVRLKYTDIAKDTVIAMLRDLEVPAPASKAIMTMVSARAS